MKTKNNIFMRYLEAILYCIGLVIGIWMCISNNIYIKMIPIAFIMGLIGQLIFGKKFMTSFFSFILALVLLQIKTPANLLGNVFITISICICSIIGEVCGWSLKKFFRIYKSKNKRKEKVKYVFIAFIMVALGLIVSSVFNGNYVTYNKLQNRLYDYFKAEYSSSSRFKIITSNYILNDNPRYVFYTQDTINNNDLGKFTIYLNDRKNVVDNYKEQILLDEAKSVENNLNEVNNVEGISVNVFYDNASSLILSFEKKVDKIERSNIEDYAKTIADYISNSQGVDKFNQIEQIRIILESESNPKDNLASYINMKGYSEMIESSSEEPYEYIMRALNVEYFD